MTVGRYGIMYAVTVQQQKVDGDDLFVASVSEFPHLRTYEKTWQNAVSLLHDAIDTTIDDFNKNGRDYPEPITKES